MTSKPRSRSLRAVSISTLRTTYRFRRYARRIDFDATHDVSIWTLRTTYRFRRYARRIDFDATHDVSISTLRTSYRFRRYARRIDPHGRGTLPTAVILSLSKGGSRASRSSRCVLRRRWRASWTSSR